jgi:LacI family transcriptional regulator
VRQPLYEVGTCIANMMLPMIGQEGAAVDVPSLSLVVRESVRRIT